jgi:xylulokinase
MSTASTSVVLAIDLGTTEVKTGLFAFDGRLVGLARAGYPTERPRAGVALQDPDAWWAAIADTIRQLAAAGRRSGDLASGPDVVAICCVGHGPTLVPADASGVATGPVVTWLDTRSSSEVDELTALTGRFSWELGVLPAALHLERHDPEALGPARWYLNSWEAVACRMTGRAAETRLAGQLRADPPDVAPAGLRIERLPPVIATGEVIGRLLPGAAAELGLAAGVPVVAGMVDAYASFFGAGLLQPGDAVDTGGTSGGFAVYADRRLEVPGAFCAPAPIPGAWILGGAMNATGKALDWLARILDAGGATAAGEDLPGQIEGLLDEAAAVAPGADGLFFLPYLAGERSPIWDSEARGAFVGLTLGHTRAHLVRSVVEASALALRHVIGPIAVAGARIDGLALSGGAARNPAWHQLKADVTGLEVIVPRVAETAALGAAITAAAGAGAYPGLVPATQAMFAIERRLAPDPAARATYDRVYAGYIDLYPALAGAFHRLGRFERGAASDPAGNS